ncbi:MAG: hypothetical protein ACRDTQ_16370 [Micromonosporaceae bacterium]
MTWSAAEGSGGPSPDGAPGAPLSARPIALWATPRSRSTAFLRAMMERGDLLVVHEPFSGLVEEGAFELAGERACSMPELLSAMLRQTAEGSRVFFKDTSDYRYEPLLADSRLHHSVINTFMIRQPRATVASHFAINPNMTLDQVGFEYLHTMFESIRQATGEVPVVIDGDDLVSDPEGMVRAYCNRVGLGFVAESLQWKSGDQDLWERTGEWHKDVSSSTGLADTGHRHRAHPDNDPRLEQWAEHHQPFYDALHALRLRPEPSRQT